MRALTKYEHKRVEQLIFNWVQSKLGARMSAFAMTSVYDEQLEARNENYQTRYPVIQVDADRVNAVVYGRAATQFLPAIPPMRVELQEPLVMFYVLAWSQIEIARRLRVAQSTVSARLNVARSLIWEAIGQPCDSAQTRTS